jgi:type I restriction enzyme S subunit
MEAVLEKLDLRNLDKSDWKSFRFEEITKRVSETVDPNTTTLEKYVGLEHIDAEDVHIKRFGTPADVSGGKLKCYPGDIIFGKRRAYQRKAAIADFEGICSAHAFVFRANPDVIDPKLFPFFLHSDNFMHSAVDISVGGLSPTINWGDLKGQVFLLPPKEEQARLAELLWAMDEVIEKEKVLLERLVSSYHIVINHAMIHGGYKTDGTIIQTKCGLLDSRIKPILLKDCLLEKPTYGANASSKAFEKDTPRYIRITDIDDEGDIIKENFVSIDSDDYQNYILKHEDFLFARTGNTVGKTLLYDSEMGLSVYAGYLIRFRLNQKVLLPKFLFYFTKSLKYEFFKRQMTKVGAQPNINAEEYQSMALPGLPIEMQGDIVEKLDSMKSRNNLIKSQISASQSLQKSLINQIF